MSLLEFRKVSVAYSGRTVLSDVSCSVSEGDWLMIVGPNGAGKSTMLRAASGTADYEGEITVCGEDRKTLKARDLARRIATLSQNHSVSYSFTVNDLVGLGRYPYRNGVFGGRGDKDEEMIETALRDVGLYEMRGRSLLTLSGGELQRAFIAQLFAQDPNVLMLDEPTNNLDLVYQKEIFELLAAWVGKGERAIVSVVHDIGLARAFGNKALLLDEGKTIAEGAVADVFTENHLNAAYDLDIAAWMKKLYSHWTEDDGIC